MIVELFFELIRVAIGSQKSLSRIPKANEWSELYAMSKKQALVGICFAGVQRLLCEKQNHGKDHFLDNSIELPEALYLQWMGMAAKIQQRNKLVNGKVIDLHQKLLKDGFRNCIVKGQVNTTYYKAAYETGNEAESLSLLRQAGDIDVWVDASRKEILAYCGGEVKGEEINASHVEFNVYDDVSVELHYMLTRLANPFYNARLIRWLSENKEQQLCNKENFHCAEVSMSSMEFNVVYYMLHMYKHLLQGEGLGLRQIMDYYFLLNAIEDKKMRTKDICTLEYMGLEKFASGMMFIMHEIFGLDADHLLTKGNERIGRFLLDEVMESGNFGHQDHRYKPSAKDSHLKRFLQRSIWKMRFVRYFPGEALWYPLALFYTFFELRFIRKQLK